MEKEQIIETFDENLIISKFNLLPRDKDCLLGIEIKNDKIHIFSQKNMKSWNEENMEIDYVEKINTFRNAKKLKKNNEKVCWCYVFDKIVVKSFDQYSLIYHENNTLALIPKEHFSIKKLSSNFIFWKIVKEIVQDVLIINCVFLRENNGHSYAEMHFRDSVSDSIEDLCDRVSINDETIKDLMFRSF